MNLLVVFLGQDQGLEQRLINIADNYQGVFQEKDFLKGETVLSFKFKTSEQEKAAQNEMKRIFKDKIGFGGVISI